MKAHSRQRYYEEVDLGDQIGPMEKVPTIETVKAFCRVWGHDVANRFNDLATAQSFGLTGPIVPGVMSMAYMAQLLNDWAPNGSLKSLDVIFRQLVYHDRPIRIAALITDKRTEAEENLVECDIALTTPEGERLINAKAIVSLPTRGS